MSGILLLDNNCFDVLAEPAALSKFKANARAAGWITQLTEVNALEVLATPGDAKQQRLIEVLKEVGGQGPMLPWPFAMLRELGTAILAGKTASRVTTAEADILLYSREEAIRIRAETAEFNRRIESAFTEHHDGIRSKMRQMMRQRGVKDPYRSTREYLQSWWFDGGVRAAYAQYVWTGLKLKGLAPMTVLEECEPWRILLDVEGVAWYERSVASQQPRRVDRMDLLQLVYLGVAPKRMIVTADRGMLRAAAAVLPGRYRNASAVHIDQLTT